MKFQNKDINLLTDNELLEAKNSLNNVENYVQEKRTEHKKLKLGLDINPAFVELKDAINLEIERRHL